MSERKNENQNFSNITITDSNVRINSDNYNYESQDKPKSSGKSKIILSVLLAFCTISGITGVTVWNYIKSKSQDNDIASNVNDVYIESLQSETTAAETITNIEYEVYLNPDYNRTSVNIPLDISVETNFNASSVSLTAELASGNTDVLNMNKTGENTWGLKVQFYESGVHKIFASAVIGDEIIESLPVSITVDELSIENIADIDGEQISNLFEILY